ncbi:hypothetical protein DSECCO2_434370 [anaerobic digester metagenome]
MKRIQMTGLFFTRVLRYLTSAGTVYCQLIDYFSTCIQRLENHPVGMFGQCLIGMPDKLNFGWIKNSCNGNIRQVTFAGQSKTSVQMHPVFVGSWRGFQKLFRSTRRPHGVAARRPVADSVDFPD